MKIRFIINPISGMGKQKGIEEVIKKHIHFPYEIVYTKKGGDATELSQTAISDKVDVVVGNSDIMRIRSANSSYGILKDCRVMIVLD